MPKTLQQNKGLQIKGNLENFLRLPSKKDAEKVKNAHKWACDIEMDKIPKEFNGVKKFLSNENQNSVMLDDVPF